MGRMYSPEMEAGRILLPPFQYAIMNPSMQQDFVRVRMSSGHTMYVRGGISSIDTAKALYEIMTEEEWLTEQDPQYLQFRQDVQEILTLLKDNPPLDEEEFPRIPFKAEQDECVDYIAAVFYTAFAELGLRETHPAIEHQFSNIWVAYVV